MARAMIAAVPNRTVFFILLFLFFVVIVFLIANLLFFCVFVSVFLTNIAYRVIIFC